MLPGDRPAASPAGINPAKRGLIVTETNRSSQEQK
jgi:hypothetical protein